MAFGKPVYLSDADLRWLDDRIRDIIREELENQGRKIAEMVHNEMLRSQKRGVSRGDA